MQRFSIWFHQVELPHFSHRHHVYLFLLACLQLSAGAWFRFHYDPFAGFLVYWGHFLLDNMRRYQELGLAKPLLLRDLKYFVSEIKRWKFIQWAKAAGLIWTLLFWMTECCVLFFTLVFLVGNSLGFFREADKTMVAYNDRSLRERHMCLIYGVTEKTPTTEYLKVVNCWVETARYTRGLPKASRLPEKEAEWIFVINSKNHEYLGYLSRANDYSGNSCCLPLSDKDGIHLFLQRHAPSTYYFWIGSSQSLSCRTLESLHLSEQYCPALYQQVRLEEEKRWQIRQGIWTGLVQKLRLSGKPLPVVLAFVVASLLHANWPGPTADTLNWHAAFWYPTDRGRGLRPL